VKRALLVAVLCAIAAGWVRGTPEYSYWRLRSALEQGDVVTAEEHLDLAVIPGVVVDIFAATTAQAAKEATGSVGSVIVGAIADALSPLVKGAIAPFTVDDVKKGISSKEYAKKIGAFELGPTMDGALSVQRLDQSALIDLNGNCGGKAAKLRLVLEKKNGPVGGLVPNWRVTGVDKASLPDFVKACAPEQLKTEMQAPKPAP
jgi:hypothetical protein